MRATGKTNPLSQVRPRLGTKFSLNRFNIVVLPKAEFELMTLVKLLTIDSNFVRKKLLI